MNNTIPPRVNKVSQPLESISDHPILIANANEYETMMTLAFSNGVYSQVLHNGHIAVELLIKAVYAKNNMGTHPHGHNLISLVERPLAPQIAPFYDDIKADRLKTTFELISSAWRMQYRYEGRPTTQEDAAMYLNAYKEVIKWIKKKYEN